MLTFLRKPYLFKNKIIRKKMPVILYSRGFYLGKFLMNVSKLKFTLFIWNLAFTQKMHIIRIS